MSENLQSRGVRLRPDQWKLCEQMCKEFGYKNTNEFIRDAVDFFAEWKSHDTTEKFLTPALESVVRATVRDSEERMARLLFKNAVELHLLSIAFHLCAMGYQQIHITSQRTGDKETKAYPTICICLLIALTGDCLSWNAEAQCVTARWNDRVTP